MQAFIHQQSLRLLWYISKICKEHELRHVIPDSDLALAASEKHPKITAATLQQSILGVMLRVI